MRDLIITDMITDEDFMDLSEEDLEEILDYIGFDILLSEEE